MCHLVNIEDIAVLEGCIANITLGGPLIRMAHSMLCERMSIDSLESTIFANERHIFVRTLMGREASLIGTLLTAGDTNEFRLVQTDWESMAGERVLVFEPFTTLLALKVFVNEYCWLSSLRVLCLLIVLFQLSLLMTVLVTVVFEDVSPKLVNVFALVAWKQVFHILQVVFGFKVGVKGKKFGKV
jgi:hypothetical protein